MTLLTQNDFNDLMTNDPMTNFTTHYTSYSNPGFFLLDILNGFCRVFVV